MASMCSYVSAIGSFHFARFSLESAKCSGRRITGHLSVTKLGPHGEDGRQRVRSCMRRLRGSSDLQMIQIAKSCPLELVRFANSARVSCLHERAKVHAELVWAVRTIKSSVEPKELCGVV